MWPRPSAVSRARTRDFKPACVPAWAYARAEAQALVPIEYSGFLWASVLGWAFFREPVTLPTIAGTVLIVAGCWLATRKGAVAEGESA